MTDEFELAAEVDELRRALARQQRATRKARSKTEMLVEAVYRAATDAQLAIGRVSVAKPPARDRRKSAGEVALVHATDWQLGKLTSDYSIELCEERIRRFAHKVLSLPQGFDIFMDGGIRRGSDVFKALAMVSSLTILKPINPT